MRRSVQGPTCNDNTDARSVGPRQNECAHGLYVLPLVRVCTNEQGPGNETKSSIGFQALNTDCLRAVSNLILRYTTSPPSTSHAKSSAHVADRRQRHSRTGRWAVDNA